MKAITACLLISSLSAEAQEAKKMISFDLEQVAVTHHEPLLKQTGEDNEIVSELPSEYKEMEQSGFRYQAPIYFGSGKNKAMMAFDTGSSYTTVTSDLCPKTNCES